MHVFRRIIGIMAIAVGLVIVAPTELEAQNFYNNISDNQQRVTVPPTGTISKEILANAPCPVIMMQGERKVASIVVDITNNVLYKYDKKGNPQIAYRVASGKESTPTSVGIRIVSHVESYPYRSAPPQTNRRKAPEVFGPNVIILTMVDSRTGIKWNNGEYIHGNNDPSSIGKHSSHGCIRMDNKVIIELSRQVKRGDIIVMKR